MNTIKIHVMSDDPADKALLIPKRKTDGAAGWDVVASEDVLIHPQTMGLVPCGFKMELPRGWEAQVRPRSSLSLKGYLVIFGTIDDDYRGEVKVVIYNTDVHTFFVKKGDRIGQLVFQVVDRCRVQLVESESDLSSTERGEGGFGSTGLSDLATPATWNNALNTGVDS